MIVPTNQAHQNGEVSKHYAPNQSSELQIFTTMVQSHIMKPNLLYSEFGVYITRSY